MCFHARRYNMNEALTVVHPEDDWRREASGRSAWQHQGHALMDQDRLDFLLRPQRRLWMMRTCVYVNLT